MTARWEISVQGWHGVEEGEEEEQKEREGDGWREVEEGRREEEEEEERKTKNTGDAVW